MNSLNIMRIYIFLFTELNNSGLLVISKTTLKTWIIHLFMCPPVSPTLECGPVPLVCHQILVRRLV